MKALLPSLALFAGLALAAHAQTLATWNFSGPPGDPTALPANISGGTILGNNAFPGNNPLFNAVSSSTGYLGASGIRNASIGIEGGALAVPTSTYFEFTLTPAAGFSLFATDLKLGSYSTGPGPLTLTFLASTNSFRTWTTLGTVSVLNDSTWALVSMPSFSFSAAIDTPVAFRIYGSDGTGNSSISNWRIDDVQFGVVAVPEPSTWATLLTGATLLGARAWRRRKARLA